MKNSYIIFLLLLMTVLFGSCKEKEKTDSELDTSCLNEYLENIQEMRDTSQFGDIDGTYPYESGTTLDDEIVELEYALSLASADRFFLQYEIDNYCTAAQKVVDDFNNSIQLTLEPGTPAELKVFGIDQKGRIEFGSDASFGGGTTFTVEAYLKYDEGFFESAIGDFIATFNNTADPYEGWMINFMGDNLRTTIGMGPQSARVLEFGGVYPDNYGEWNHIAMVYDETLDENQLKMYVNGELFFKKTNDIVDGSNVLQTYQPNTQNMNMWAFQEPTDVSRCMTGYIKKFRMWNTAKSVDEINELMNTDVTGSEADIICAWDFVEMPEDVENIPDKTGKFSAKLVGKYKWYQTEE